MDNPGPHDMISCPYNKCHQIEHYRMQIHLQKCRKQHPKCKKVTCPFDATHIVNDMELDYHVLQCPKRNLLDSQIYVLDNDYRPVVEVQTSSVQSEENWDDVVCTSYVPDMSKKGPHIITKVQGATPSERRKARQIAIATFKPRE